MNDFEEILRFWLGELDDFGRADSVHAARWWKKDPSFDDAIRHQFGALYDRVTKGEHESWLATPRGRLSYIIVLDQFSRNLFRGTARVFAQDKQALETALSGIGQGLDKALRHAERTFFYMPLMHSEDLAMQERCVRLFATWRDALEGELRKDVESSLDFAEQHRNIIRRFGRFPHRNAQLGRESTTEELEFLKQPGSSF